MNCEKSLVYVSFRYKQSNGHILHSWFCKIYNLSNDHLIPKHKSFLIITLGNSIYTQTLPLTVSNYFLSIEGNNKIRLPITSRSFDIVAIVIFLIITF